jgi:C-terminal processing protease CtpA/Prc
MKSLKFILPVAAVLLLAGQAAAQEAEKERAREMEAREAEFSQQMREAEERLATAAQQVAELSQERLSAMGDVRQYAYKFSSKPRMGVNIGTEDEAEGPVKGIGILSVTPGSAADDAGLRAGDILTSIDGESLKADSAEESSLRVLKHMKTVEEGDQFEIEYLRDGNIGKVQIEPRIVPSDAYAWASKDPAFVMPQMQEMPQVHVSPETIQKFQFSFGGWRGGWGDMEVVELTEGLGRYFGADSGLLVISAPASNAFKLQEGDVIQKIDGREPSSVNHCMRILGSYQPGEKLVLNILRDKKPQTIEIEVPDDRTSQMFDELSDQLLHQFEGMHEFVIPARAPLPAPAPAADERT